MISAVFFNEFAQKLFVYRAHVADSTHENRIGTT